MKRYKRTLLAACVAAIGCQTKKAPPAPAEEATPPPPTTTPQKAPQPPRERIDGLMQPLIEDGWAMGIVVGVVTPEGTEVLAYGRRSRDDPRPPDADSLFEIGSLSKVFTATLLADMVARGEVQLEDPIGKYLPPDVTPPRRGEDEIRLVDLATHTSGLPVISDNFWLPGVSVYDVNAAGRSWSGYTVEKLYSYLQNPSPPLKTKRAFLYSNLGMGLLGHLLERRGGKTYEELLIERVLTPLGMQSTRVTLDEAQSARLVPGHDADGDRTEPWESSVLAGAFALRSSLNDLLLFVKANLGLLDTPLSSALTATHREHFTRDDLQRVGLGWNLNKFGVVFHTGTTGGYRSAIFMLPDRKTGIVVLTNSLVGGSTDGRALLFEALEGSVLNVVVGVPPLPVSFPRVATIEEARLGDYAGQYGLRASDTNKLEVFLKDGALLATIPGRPPARLYPLSEDVFFMKAYDAQFSFKRDEAGQVGRVGVQIGGDSGELDRLGP